MKCNFEHERGEGIRPICSFARVNLNILAHKFNPIKIRLIEFKMY